MSVGARWSVVDSWMMTRTEMRKRMMLTMMMMKKSQVGRGGGDARETS
jgi:hypothetical protein